MRIPYLIYRVRPAGRVAELGWKGWRMKYWSPMGFGDRPLFLPDWC